MNQKQPTASPEQAEARTGPPPCWYIEYGDHGQITMRKEEADSALANGAIRVTSYDVSSSATHPTASNAGERETPKWPNVETAMEDPMFQQARAIMGTNTWFQDNALRNVINYVLSTIKPPACKGIPRPGCNYLAPCDTSCNKCGEIHHHYQMVAALASKPPAGEQKPVAWAVSECWSSANPTKKVLVLARNAAEAARDEQHHSFIRWVHRANTQPKQVAQDSEQAADYRWLAEALTSNDPYGELAKAFGHFADDHTPSRQEFDDAIRAARARGEGGSKS